MKDMLTAFREKSAEERAVALLQAWFDLVEMKCCNGGAVPEGLERSFFKWLDDPNGRQVRDRALQRMADSWGPIPEITKNIAAELPWSAK
jgi:hypothetical protein